MKKRNLAFIDLETTGLDPEKHEIIEIGGIIVKQIHHENGQSELEVLEEFVMKVKPEHIETADPESLLVNGYKADEWIFAIDLPQAMKVLAEKTEGDILVAQNVAFDWLFLEKAFAKTGVTNKMDFHRLDLLSMAYTKLYHDDKAKRFSLRALAEYYGVKNEKAHSALSDIRATYEIYRKILDI